MSAEVIQFFTNLIGTEVPAVNNINPNLLKDLFNFSLPTDKADSLVQEVTKEEIKEAFFNQGNEKSPGPDGFSPFFFKKTWHVIESDVVAAISQFFQDSFLLPAFNTTIIALVPKLPNLSKSSFVKGRNITDNTLLAQELVRAYSKKNLSPRCSLKIDLHKAFDSLNWNFISAILKSIDLPRSFVTWIEICYSTASYPVSFNGSLTGFFKGAKGLRQGDPLSLLLFVLSLNVIFHLLNLAASRGLFNYHPKYKKIGLTHLSFADDRLIFYKGNVNFVTGVTCVLENFYEISGLKLNASKSELFDVGMSIAATEEIKKIKGFKLDILPVHYLGIPLLTRKISEKDCVILIDSIKTRLHNWSTKTLSYAGRLELIKIFLSSITNFWCRQVFLPHSVLKKIEQLCSRFFWKGTDKAGTGARVSWKNICHLKSEGEGSIWVAWLQNYVFKKKDFWTVDINSTASWSLKKLLKLRPEAHQVLSSGALNATAIWDFIREKKPKVPWQKLLWFPLHIPKHSLIAWMAFLDRLPTKERL
ncbi:uncharacterized protein LOC120185726 [Hibiscus syriacus]|uniref:uncharacterized protein LOC120185726 n=1 Tax=Hibiscus syriacus TaxID=106335 RepID=UPI0019238531|nr:uncharacterized protein LOC120185726 [Hibiscus syriacus]